ncbi:MAG: DUF2752 domain-containing protein [Planctomycetota bacterium]|nr:DUF2752 domain-containing protein [Planctomycetota bacterium]
MSSTTGAHRREGSVRSFLVIAGVWLLFVAMAYEAGRRGGEPIQLCLFRRATGMPCATCGSTRAVAHLASFDFAGAIALNPFMTGFLIAAPLWLAWRATLGRRYPPVPESVRRRVTWALLALLGVNWAYVLWHERGSWDAPRGPMPALPGADAIAPLP